MSNITVKQFLLKKFPTSEYMDCPIPKEYWEIMQEYAEYYTLQNKVSDISAEEIELEAQRRYAILEKYNNLDGFMKREAFKNGAEWYASIVNENKDIDEEYLKITGHNSPKEYAAYKKGRKDEQEVIMKWIEKWNGSSNSELGTLLKKKFNELFTYLSKQTNSHKLKNKTEW